MEDVLTTTEQKLINLAILCNPEGLASVKASPNHFYFHHQPPSFFSFFSVRPSKYLKS